jgi:hypothetical protein
MKMADAQTKLGQLIEGEAIRDAIHIAVAPVIAAEKLKPGTHIGLNSDGTATINPLSFIGIVDPFLEKVVQRGEQFYLFLYPNTITSLKHLWTHPAFEDDDKVTVVKSKKESEAWLRNFIKNADCPSYETVIAAAVDGTNSWSDGYMHFVGRDAHGEIPPEFWDHVEAVTGKKISARPSYFSCSC